jgi:transcriptional regulator with XRE-family HTH domain
MHRETKTVLRALGARIGELRAAAGITQEQASERLGMLTPNYARIEQGRANATIDTLVRIAKAFDVDVLELFRAPKNPTRRRPGRPGRSG